MKFQRFLISPICGGILAFSAVFAGALVSICADEIKNSFPFFLSLNVNQYEKPTLATLLFWGSCLFFTIFTIIRQNHIDSDIKNQRNSLINTLQTLPPHNFSMKYRDLFKSNDANITNIKSILDLAKSKRGKLSDKDLDLCEEAINTLLQSYIILAKIWDEPESNLDDCIVYQANFMYYYNINEIPKLFEDQLFEINHFFVDKNLNAVKSSIDGIILLFDNAFSVSTSPGISIDMQEGNLVFPVTFVDKIGKRFQNLPGAPKALVDKKPQWISNTSDIVNFCKKEQHFDSEILRKIENHYNQNSNTKSLLSIPIYEDEGSNYPVGVINIYRNKSNILRNEIRSEEFCAFVEPFNSMLYNILDVYTQISLLLYPEEADS